MTFKWVPIAAETLRTPKEIPSNSHDKYFGFCPAKSQLYRSVVKPRGGTARIMRACSWQTVCDRVIDGSPPGGWNRFLRIWRNLPKYPNACAPIRWKTASIRFLHWPKKSG